MKNVMVMGWHGIGETIHRMGGGVLFAPAAFTHTRILKCVGANGAVFKKLPTRRLIKPYARSFALGVIL